MATQEKHYNIVKNSFVLIEDYKQGSKVIEIHNYNKRIFVSITNDEISMYTDSENTFTRTTTNLIKKLYNIDSIKPYYNRIIDLYLKRVCYYDSDTGEVDYFDKIITQIGKA